MENSSTAIEHRFSTAEMGEIVASLKAVTQCAVFDVHCELKERKPLGLVVLKSGNVDKDNVIQKENIQNVSKEISALASFRGVFLVKKIAENSL